MLVRAPNRVISKAVCCGGFFSGERLKQWFEKKQKDCRSNDHRHRKKLQKWPPNQWSILCFLKRSPLKNPPPIRNLEYLIRANWTIFSIYDRVTQALKFRRRRNFRLPNWRVSDSPLSGRSELGSVFTSCSTAMYQLHQSCYITLYNLKKPPTTDCLASNPVHVQC